MIACISYLVLVLRDYVLLVLPFLLLDNQCNLSISIHPTAGEGKDQKAAKEKQMEKKEVELSMYILNRNRALLNVQN